MVDFVLAAFACLAKCFVVKIALCLRAHSFIVCYFVCFTVTLADPIASVAVVVESVPALSVSAPVASQPTVEHQPASQLASMPPAAPQPAVSLFATPAGGLGGPGGGGPGGGGGGLSLMEMIRARRKD